MKSFDCEVCGVAGIVSVAVNGGVIVLPCDCVMGDN